MLAVHKVNFDERIVWELHSDGFKETYDWECRVGTATEHWASGEKLRIIEEQ